LRARRRRLRMGKARPFLEILASFLKEDYRFPILEIVAFIYTVGPYSGAFIIVGSPPSAGPQSPLASMLGGFTIFVGLAIIAPVFGILVLRNIPHGLGNELERGVIQSLLSYPLKRRSLLTARILSSIGVVFTLLLSITVLDFYIVAPDVVSQNIMTICIASMASLSFPFLVSSIVLLLTLFFKRGSISLMVGILLYFSSFFLFMILLVLAQLPGMSFLIKICAIIYPSLAITMHYQTGWDPVVLKQWTPSYDEACLYVGAAYALTFLLLTVGYLYFDRRLEI